MSYTQIAQLAKVIFKQPSKRYLTYIRSPQWARVRAEHLERCDRWCEICRKARACQVHHWTYERLGHEYPQDLAAVCVTCHHRLHVMVGDLSIHPTAANDNQQLSLPLGDAA